MVKMAVGGEVCEFDTWLNNKLLSFNTDEGVFGSYIKGILEGEESLDEKTQALQEILSEITEDNIAQICQEILEKWTKFHVQEEKNHENIMKVSEDVDVKLARLMESQAKATVTTRNNYTDEEKRIREAILQQYGQMSDDECDEEEEGGDNPKENGGLVKNVNVAAVKQAEKERREKAKIESQKKKEKDKEDREKQKQMAQERKEKRKTQKGERRR